ncbi:MAG: nitrogen regulation protein NR(I) [Acidiferrobacterales bacterium]|nr:nitrogen regulation protein NR(I) [Acidiferrobacterales bacterium]
MRKSSAAPVWIVDDDESIRWVLTRALNNQAIESRSFASAKDALDQFDQEFPRVVITDIRMEGIDGLSFLDRVQAVAPELPVIVMTAYSDLDTTVESFKRGATEHLPKPFDIEVAVTLIRRVMDETSSDNAPTASQEPARTSMIGDSVVMQEVFRAIGRLSKSDLNVLITGESGTGKELVARALFESSSRKSQPFVAINAAAIPADLLESELFGHEKGAFTGANQRRVGRFEQANHGTLFLDEIGDMPHDLQSRLLRVMSEGKFYRVGGVNEISVDVRIIAATNQDIESRVDSQSFRTDLFHRLNVVRIALAPVRDRGNDIPRLLRHFMSQAAKQFKVEEKSFNQGAMACLCAYAWPGNVREIENFCRSITVMSPSRVIMSRDLPPQIEECRYGAGNTEMAPDDWEQSLQFAIGQMLESDELVQNGQIRDEIERVMLECTLQSTDGSRQKTADILGWGRNTITRKVKEL